MKLAVEFLQRRVAEHEVKVGQAAERVTVARSTLEQVEADYQAVKALQTELAAALAVIRAPRPVPLEVPPQRDVAALAEPEVAQRRNRKVV